MSNEKQIINGFSKWVDERAPFDKWVPGIAGKLIEVADGPFFKIAINKGYEILPEEYKDEALSIMEAAQTGNIDSIAEEAIEALVDNVDTPLMDENERILLKGLWNTIKAYLFREKALASLDENTVGGGGHGDDPTDD